MDELKLNLTTDWMRNIVAKLIAMAIRKKTGYDISIFLNKIQITASNGKIKIHADVDVETSNETFVKAVKTIGLDKI